MLYTVVDCNLIFSENGFSVDKKCRSSNPYDYIRNGYFIDDAKLYGGQNDVNFNINYSGNSAGNMLYNANK